MLALTCVCLQNPSANFPGGPLVLGCPSPIPLVVREPEAAPLAPPERGAGPALGSATINPNLNRRATERTLERQKMLGKRPGMWLLSCLMLVVIWIELLVMPNWMSSLTL